LIEVNRKLANFITETTRLKSGRQQHLVVLYIPVGFQINPLGSTLALPQSIESYIEIRDGKIIRIFD
jgi:hypothetical protein